jgi:hypothetical protein
VCSTGRFFRKINTTLFPLTGRRTSHNSRWKSFSFDGFSTLLWLLLLGELHKGDQGHHEAVGINGDGPGDDTVQQHLLYLGLVDSAFEEALFLFSWNKFLYCIYFAPRFIVYNYLKNIQYNAYNTYNAFECSGGRRRRIVTALAFALPSGMQQIVNNLFYKLFFHNKIPV